MAQAVFRLIDGQDPAEIARLSRFASGIVKEHFDPLIGAEQNDYMIGKFQTGEAIAGQIASGYRYYWVLCENDPAGFLAFFPRDGAMYLSKFYVAKPFRGRHLAGEMMRFVEEETLREGLDAVTLNVNRGNSDVIQIYEHFGFQKIREEKNDIGNGFYMDDYVLELRLFGRQDASPVF